MAEAQEKTRKPRKASGPRQEKPAFLVISYTNEDGSPVKLDANRLNIAMTKDATRLVSMFTSGYDGTQIVKQVRFDRENDTASNAGPTA